MFPIYKSNVRLFSMIPTLSSLYREPSQNSIKILFLSNISSPTISVFRNVYREANSIISYPTFKVFDPTLDWSIWVKNFSLTFQSFTQFPYINLCLWRTHIKTVVPYSWSYLGCIIKVNTCLIYSIDSPHYIYNNWLSLVTIIVII